MDSLSNKLNELEAHAELYKADIILITEHLSKNISSKFENVFSLDGYNCFEEISGRGVCIFYKDNLSITTHDKINEMYKPSLFINIKSSNIPLNIGLIYRSPNNEEKENKKLNNQLTFASKKLKNLVIFGDFNHPSIDWENFYSNKSEDHCDSKFLFEFMSINTNQLITSPTHHKPNCKSTLIDLIITKTPEIISNIRQNPPIGKSHHQVITAKIKINKNNLSNKDKPSQKIVKPNFDKADYDAINRTLFNENWEDILDQKDVNETWNLIKDKIEQVKHQYVPIKFINTSKIRSRPVTLDDNLLFLLRDKRYLFKVYKKYKTKTSLYNYNLARNRVSYKIKSMKINKESKIAKNIKHNPKAFYQYIASKTLKKEGIAELENDMGELTNSDQEKCDILNNFFSSVFTKENDDEDIPEFTYENDILNPLLTCTVTIKDFENALFKLNVNKSPGPDNFHPKLLKNSAKSLAKPLKILFDKTLSEGELPLDFKLAEVRPIFKKGSKTTPGNYRPVSLTSIICKVMESFIKKSLNEHLINNNILSKHQYGFVSGRSTITQLLVTLNEWLFNLDNDIPTDAAYMDFRKAFDSVPHKRLINKLKAYKIDGPILKWIISFLSNRSQYVKLNNASSSKLKVTSGVPQGSVLGPTLFIYFINDLPIVTNDTPIKIFADDTKVYNGINNDDNVKKLQEAIDSMFEWTQKWLLKFNKEKCKLLHIGKNNKKNKYFIGTGHQRINLDESDLEKDLGIYIDPNLDFKKHIKNTVKKSSFSSYKILKNFTFKKSNILVPLFKTLVRPILEYGNVIWANGIKKYMTKIENVQRRFTKHISGISKLPYEERLKKIKLPSLEYRQLRGDMIQVFKIAHNYYDNASVDNIFTFNKDSRLRGHNLKIIKKFTNKSKYQKFFTN